jgi:serine O-acetyltransferase
MTRRRRTRRPDAAREQLFASIHVAQPRLREAIVQDAAVTLSYRGEGEFDSRLDALAQMIRLAWVSDAFFAQVLYRAKARMQALGVPLLPRIAHRLAVGLAQVSIGDPVVIEPGVYIVHGQVVIDGIVSIGAGAVLAPFVTIGLRAGNFQGPTLERGVQVGTGAKLLGPIRVGAGARIGANAVVLDDVPAGATVAGAPARRV